MNKIVAHNNLILKITETQVHYVEVERDNGVEPSEFERAALNMIEHDESDHLSSMLTLKKVSAEKQQLIEYFVLPE